MSGAIISIYDLFKIQGEGTKIKDLRQEKSGTKDNREGCFTENMNWKKLNFDSK